MTPLRILVDADACPVKDEVYKVAWRREVPVTVVSNAHLRVPSHPLIDRVVVSGAFDAADDWIVDRAGDHTVVITGEILLADRCLKKGSIVIAHNGKPFTNASIGGAIATRAIMADLRVAADGIGGARHHSPGPTARDFSRRWTVRWCGWRKPEKAACALSRRASFCLGVSATLLAD